jgi:hypothetical protein
MARAKINPILLISSLDPTCQSGLVKQAIILDQLGKTSLTVCTSIASQNDIEIDDLALLSFEEIKRQLDAIARRYWIDWAVISGIYELNLAATLINYLLQNRPGIHILWEPSLQQTDSIINERLNNQDRELFDALCKKVHTVFLSPKELKRFYDPSTAIALWSTTCHVYLPGSAGSNDILYCEGKSFEMNSTLNQQHEMIFLTTLASFLYEGNEIPSACSHSLLFLNDHPIN